MPSYTEGYMSLLSTLASSPIKSYMTNIQNALSKPQTWAFTSSPPAPGLAIMRESWEQTRHYYHYIIITPDLWTGKDHIHICILIEFFISHLCGHDHIKGCRDSIQNMSCVLLRELKSRLSFLYVYTFICKFILQAHHPTLYPAQHRFSISLNTQIIVKSPKCNSHHNLHTAVVFLHPHKKSSLN